MQSIFNVLLLHDRMPKNGLHLHMEIIVTLTSKWGRIMAGAQLQSAIPKRKKQRDYEESLMYDKSAKTGNGGKMIPEAW